MVKFDGFPDDRLCYDVEQVWRKDTTLSDPFVNTKTFYFDLSELFNVNLNLARNSIKCRA